LDSEIRADSESADCECAATQQQDHKQRAQRQEGEQHHTVIEIGSRKEREQPSTIQMTGTANTTQMPRYDQRREPALRERIMSRSCPESPGSSTHWTLSAQQW
jgi:hypothetical protein